MRRPAAELAGVAIALALIGATPALQVVPTLTCNVAFAAAPQRTKLPAIAWLCETWLRLERAIHDKGGHLQR